MAIPTPNGSGMGLGEFLELLRRGVNRSLELNGDDSINVEQFDGGRNLSFVGAEKKQFFGKITGWATYGESGKRWKYSWEEVEIGFENVAGSGGDNDADIPISGGRTGTFTESATTYLINLAEINNTKGNDDIQGNGTELVAPLGGQNDDGTSIAAPLNRIVPIWISSRQDGSVLMCQTAMTSGGMMAKTLASRLEWKFRAADLTKTHILLVEDCRQTNTHSRVQGMQPRAGMPPRGNL